MLDAFDYKEPKCSLCDGKDFYNPKLDGPVGRVPVDRIISKVDECFNKNNFSEAGRLLEYWKNEAVSLNDLAGELSIESELVGFYRKTDNRKKGLKSIDRALDLVEQLNQTHMASGATVYLNSATAFKAFGYAERAIELYQNAEKVYNKVLAVGDARFAGLYNNMALTLVDLKRYKEAEICYKKAIEVICNVENSQPDLAITYVNMAHLYELTGNKNKITDCLFSAYNILNKDNLIKNGYFAYVLEKCAPSFEYFGYDVIAKEFIKTSGEIYERS